MPSARRQTAGGGWWFRQGCRVWFGYASGMAKKASTKKAGTASTKKAAKKKVGKTAATKHSPKPAKAPPAPGKPSSLLDTRVVYCGDCVEQLAKLPDNCVDLVYIDPPFNSNRNYEVFWGETKEKRSFKDRHASTQAYIDYMRPRCVQPAHVLKMTGCFYDPTTH